MKYSEQSYNCPGFGCVAAAAADRLVSSAVTLISMAVPVLDQKFFYYYDGRHQCNKDGMKLTKLSPLLLPQSNNSRKESRGSAKKLMKDLWNEKFPNRFMASPKSRNFLYSLWLAGEQSVLRPTMAQLHCVVIVFSFPVQRFGWSE